MGRKTNRSLVIVNYHNIIKEGDVLEGLPINLFENQLRQLQRYMNVLPLEHGLQLSEQGALPPRAVAITFDDGYKSHVKYALPLLEKYKLSATFFVSSHHIDDNIMWNDRLYLSIMHSKKSQINVDEFDLGDIAIASKSQKIKAFNQLLKIFKYQTITQRKILLERLGDKLMGDAPLMVDDLMLSTGDIQVLHQHGMSIGSHTLEHPILSLESAADVQRQLATDKENLEAIIGHEVTLFAYPNGKPGYDYNDETIKLVREAGFKYALTTKNALYLKQNSCPYEIPRVSAPENSTFSMAKLLLPRVFYRAKKQSVLFLENGKGFGGASLALLEILQNWPKFNRIKPYVCVNSSNKHYQCYDQYADKLTYPSLKVNTFKAPNRLWRNTLYSIDFLKKISVSLFILIRTRPSVVYLNNDPYNSYHMAIAAKLLGIPYVMHIRGNISPSKLCRWVCDNAAQNIAISTWIYQSLEKVLTKGKRNAIKIFDGITLQTLPKPLEVKPKSIKIVMVGGFYGWKGQEVVVHAFAQIAKDYPEVTLEFVGALEEPNNIQRKVMNLVKQFDLEQQIKFVAFAQNIKQIYHSAQILIHASTEAEPFGRVIAEAMSAGLVVIASDQGGPRDIIDHDINGYLIPAAIPELLAKKLREVLDHYQDLYALRKAAINKAEQFSCKINAEHVHQLVMEIIGTMK